MEPKEVADNFFKHLERAQLLMEVARWREALHEYSLHLAEFPDTYGALCYSALCHLELHEFQLALDMTKRAIEAAPEEEWAYRIRSSVFTENGEPSRALDEAKLCVEKAPGSPHSINCLFWAQANYGSLDDAEITLRSLMEAIPGTSDSHEAAGYLAIKRKKNLEAEKHYLEALKINPESVGALNNLGVVYLNLAQSGKGMHYRQKSVEMFERAVKLQPTFKLAQNNISAASRLTKVGAPAGLIFLVWMGVRVLSSATEATSKVDGVQLSADNFSKLSPITSSYLLTAANLYFDLLIIASIAVAISCVSLRWREAVMYQLAHIKGWLIPFVLFAGAVALYIFAFRFTGTSVEETPPFSNLAIITSIIIVIFTGINVFRHWNIRRT